MFTSNQVITATSLVKNFRKFALLLRGDPQALLITQRGKDPLVLVNASVFEELLQFKLQATEAGFRMASWWGDEEATSEHPFVAEAMQSL